MQWPVVSVTAFRLVLTALGRSLIRWPTKGCFGPCSSSLYPVVQRVESCSVSGCEVARTCQCSLVVLVP
jgi:hypothetical protein